MADRIFWWSILAACLIGHLGIHVAIYNRLNGFGIRRRVLKAIEYGFAFTTLLIPLAMAWVFRDALTDLVLGRPENLPIPAILMSYGMACLLCWIVFGLPWLAWRPILGLEWVKTQRDIEVVDIRNHVDHTLPLTNKCRFAEQMPLNQIFELSIEQIQLPVAGLPAKLDGYRLAQFSDVHLTGHIHRDFCKYVVERATEWQPNLMALSGDIIDSHHCVDWLTDIFSGARATDGCYFILGNHDTRIASPDETRAAMSSAGWIDVGQEPTTKRLADVESEIIGNESPWFPVANIPRQSSAFRLLLSHSPDQFPWARKHNVHLMLAGHTHGGQGRLPLVGPILSPSFHGSRWASGDFYKPPTTLHVSRGVCGTHLLRINCRPQLSLLTLRSA
ncbi:metallophosphoesterase [Planctomycetes bacterium K23_9]|uniref:Putative metallophosphoesterase n=1 Tax=Stieleria marina TaxID=1930275 RepID=A0A517NLZ5_9BACT|nr:putative metallophosphoesterase [Planctomycetes bacterium K23_9]